MRTKEREWRVSPLLCRMFLPGNFGRSGLDVVIERRRDFPGSWLILTENLMRNSMSLCPKPPAPSQAPANQFLKTPSVGTVCRKRRRPRPAPPLAEIAGEVELLV